MPRQTVTEREVASDLKEVLNRYIHQGGLPFEQVSVERKVGARYPDIVVWTDYNAKRAFAFWEIQAPGLGAKENIDAVLEKSAALSVRYVVLWDFQSGRLCEVRDRQLLPLKEYPVYLLRSLEEWTDPFRRVSVEEQAKKILDDLAQLAHGESLTPYVPDKFYFIGILQGAIYRLVPVLREQIFQGKKQRDVRERLDRWAVQQGYPTGLPDLDDLLARHWAYSLAVRIFFYFTVRRCDPDLPDLISRRGGGRRLSDLLWAAFSQAVNWRAVFERSPLDDLGLPPTAEAVLSDLLDGFHRYDFGLLKEDVIGQIMESLIPPEERHALGQYFTREDLVDFILGFVADRDDAPYLDPTCGSGIFLNRLYSRLRWLSQGRADHAGLLERLWGVEIAHFPAELATINLFRQDVQDTRNFPRIIVRDFFQIQPGQTFAFPSTRPSALEDSRARSTMPLFHGIVGNFPYIRQELIERQTPGYKRTIVQAVAREWFWKDPGLFEVKGIPEKELESIRQEGPETRQQWLDGQVQKGRVDLRLSGQADIYAYLFYHAAAFLEERGRLGIVTSNAWLDVAYGYELKRFFLRHFKIIAVVASWAEPWFEDAAVNTAFVILERCEDEVERGRNFVRFVKVKRPLSELLPQDLLMQHDRWQQVNALVREIEAADTEAVSWPATGQMETLRGVHTAETDAFRIRLVPQAELEAELDRKGETARWGLCLRAPQVYFDLLEAAGDRLVPLGLVAEVRRGYTTGINNFFYLELLPEPAQTSGAVRVRNARGWVGEIEETCLQPVVRSPRELPAPWVDRQRLRFRLFLPADISRIAEGMVAEWGQKLKGKKLRQEEWRQQERKFFEELTGKLEQALRETHPLAYAYVQWGEKQRTREGQLWPEVPTVRDRWAWWLVREATTPDGLWPKAFNDRFLIGDNVARAASSDRFYEIVARDEARKNLLLAILNSTVVALFIETNGRVNLGEGALDNMVYEAERCPIPEVSRIRPDAAEKIIHAYHQLNHRPVGPMAEEVRRRDRQALDEAVLEGLDLDPKEYLPRIYEGLVEMVRERLALPQMRTTRKRAGRIDNPTWLFRNPRGEGIRRL